MKLLKNSVELAGFVGVFVLMLSSKAEAQADCSQVTLETCPSFFKEQCSDKAYFENNVDACFNVMADAKPDEPFCSGPEYLKCKPLPKAEPSAECAAIDDPVKQHFCSAGQENCPTKIPNLLGQYDQVLQGLDGSLAKYDDLTTLDLGLATSIDVLCAYPIERLHTLRSEAESELSDFQDSADSIQAIDNCTATMQGFIDAGAPNGIPEETWDQIARRLTDGMSQIQDKQGKIASNIDALEAAPEKLRSLQIAYGLICPDSPDQSSSSTGVSQ